ncbi:MAG: sulfite exporter TauE/SafE family protein [bacterium]
MEFFAGLMFGFAGSLHCIGMCGPIVLALSTGQQSFSKLLLGRLAYNLGRVFTYTMVGAIVGWIGGALLIPLLQEKLTIIMGVVILIGALFPLLVKSASTIRLLPQPLYQRLISQIASLLTTQSVHTLFLLGILNGLLPCGFVYMGIAGAVATGSLIGGVLFMAGFGVGTIPAMLSFAISPRLISVNARTKLARMLPAFTILVGILLIVRGLALGIPYLSPKLQDRAASMQMEHHH